MTLRCPDVHDELELFVLGELPPDRTARIRAHLAGCPRCRAAEEECRLLLCEIKLQGKRPCPREGFERALRTAVGAEIGAARRTAGRRRTAGAVAAVAAAALIGVVIWQLWRREAGGGSPGGAGTSPGAGVPIARAGELPEKWSYAGAKAATASPGDGIVVRASQVYLLGEEPDGAHVVAVDAVAGTRRWRSETASRGYLAADAARVFCLARGERGGLELVALSASDGEMLWRYAPGGAGRFELPCRPVLLTPDRVCWTRGRAVHLLDARTGEALWVRSLADEGPLSCPAAQADRLYVVTGEGLYCLDSASGSVLWREALGEPAGRPARPLLAVAGDRAYFVRTDRGGRSTLSCMDLPAREPLWKRSVPSVRYVLAAEQRVYLRARHILALHSGTGGTAWARPAGGCGPLTLLDGRIHFVDSSGSGRLVCLEEGSGSVAWEVSGLRSCDAFAMVGDTGYIKTQDGIVHAIALCRLGRP